MEMNGASEIFAFFLCCLYLTSLVSSPAYCIMEIILERLLAILEGLKAEQKADATP